jgi:hypothetical protein
MLVIHYLLLIKIHIKDTLNHVFNYKFDYTRSEIKQPY